MYLLSRYTGLRLSSLGRLPFPRQFHQRDHLQLAELQIQPFPDVCLLQVYLPRLFGKKRKEIRSYRCCTVERRLFAAAIIRESILRQSIVRAYVSRNCTSSEQFSPKAPLRGCFSLARDIFSEDRPIVSLLVRGRDFPVDFPATAKDAGRVKYSSVKEPHSHTKWGQRFNCSIIMTI